MRFCLGPHLEARRSSEPSKSRECTGSNRKFQTTTDTPSRGYDSSCTPIRERGRQVKGSPRPGTSSFHTCLDTAALERCSYEEIGSVDNIPNIRQAAPHNITASNADISSPSATILSMDEL